MESQLWGKVNNKNVYLITLSNGDMTVRITNFGAAVVSLCVPDRNGKPADVVMGFDTLEEYIDQKYYVGVVIGRCANRIKDASFVLNGKEYQLDQNEGKNHLHGGFRGFGNAVWEIVASGGNYLTLKYLSPDGEGGYPGNLECTVEYRLEDDQLKIYYSGIADRDTIMNLTNHSYFNLNGHQNGTIKDHMVSITADQFTEIDAESICTGKVLPVDNTPLDLRNPREIGEMLAREHIQMKYGCGYNHNYVLNCGNEAPAADLYSPKTGIGMQVLTNMEGMHFYTGNFLEGSLHGKNGAIYDRFAAVCFETQHFPNAVNIKNFPTPVIKEREEKKSFTAFRFYTL